MTSADWIIVSAVLLTVICLTWWIAARWLFPTLTITICRVCQSPLHQPGGYGLMWIGGGFCATCATTILRRVHRP